MKKKTKETVHKIINIGVAVILIGGTLLPIILTLLNL
jgi:hypothetical protein